jgi:hypothetical protein
MVDVGGLKRRIEVLKTPYFYFRPRIGAVSNDNAIRPEPHHGRVEGVQ